MIYSLQADDLVVARIQPINSNGVGQISDANTVGALILREPLQMQAPINGDGTSES